MTIYIALLRAVNVGGTGKLPMSDLVRLCLDAGFTDVRTYIASGNAVFRSDEDEDAVRAALEARLEQRAEFPDHVRCSDLLIEHRLNRKPVPTFRRDALAAYAGKPVGVLVRCAREIADIVARNPFADRPGNRVMALFTDLPLPADPLDGASGLADEQVRRGEREIFVFYPRGQSDTRLRLPAMRDGTARNMNTIDRLAAMAATSAR